MNKDIYRTSRILYVVEEAAAYLITLLISGAYLAKLTLYLGFSDSLTALLSSFVNLGYVFQLLAISIFKRGRVKRKVTIFYLLNELFFVMLYVTPFIKVSPYFRTVIFITFLLAGHFILNIASSPKTNWFMTLIPDKRRGKFTAFKEAVSLVCGIAFTFLTGIVVDYYEEIGNTEASFIACSIIIFALMLTHILALIFSKEKEPIQDNDNKSSFFSNTKDIICDKKIFSIILLSVLWSVCMCLSTPFFGTYQVKELGFSMTFVAVLTTLTAVSRIIASVFLGIYADKTSFAKMLRICYILAVVSFISSALAVPSNGHVMFSLHFIFYGAAMGGINSAQINLIYDYVCPEKRQDALSIKNTFCGFFGFGTTVIATPLLNYLQKANFGFFGIHIYAQQIFSFISLIMTALLIVYVTNIINSNRKEK